MRRELEASAPVPAAAPPVESAGAAAQVATAAAALPPPPVATPEPPAREDVLDVGALGAAVAGRAMTRTLQRPGFWIAVVAVGALVYWWLR
jgi:hypothetical protein